LAACVDVPKVATAATRLCCVAHDEVLLLADRIDQVNASNATPIVGAHPHFTEGAVIEAEYSVSTIEHH
jgi:hypothetical protein